MESKSVLTILLLCASAAFNPAAAASRFARQAPDPGPNITEIEVTLDLILYLPNLTPQVQQAVQNLTTALQNQTDALQQAVQNALQNVSSQGTDLTDQLQSFLTNLQSQLNQANSNISSQLNQTLTTAITNLQNYLQTNEAKLQQLIDTFGQNITNSVGNLQGQVANVTKFLQDGLKNLSLSNSGNLFLQQEIQRLNNSLSSGALNHAITNLIVNLQGQTLSLTDLLAALRTQAQVSEVIFISINTYT